MASDDGSGQGAPHERIAVGLSFWIGAVGLAVLKGVVYASTGSAMVRTSMFESMGDVVSSAIIAVTHWQVSSSKDAQDYPVGKARFAPLGVLFFCAFMCSSMCSTAIDSLQTLIAPEEPDAAAEAAVATVRQIFADRPRLRWAYGPGRDIEALASQYGALFAGGDSGGDLDSRLSVMLMSICVAVKFVLYCYCKVVARKKNSEMVRALGVDHMNDTATNALVIGTLAGVARLERAGYDSTMLAKIDPAVSFLLSLWILYGWVTSALEQVKALSDRRAGSDELDLAAVQEAANRTLHGVPLEVQTVDAYFAGEGLRVRLDLRPAGKSSTVPGDDRLALALSRLREEVRQVAASGESDILAVDLCVRPRTGGGEGHSSAVGAV